MLNFMPKVDKFNNKAGQRHHKALSMKPGALLPNTALKAKELENNVAA